MNRSIHAVASGGIYLDPAFAGRAVAAGARQVPAAAVAEVDLSSREIEVARLTASGYSTKMIARKLNIGGKSVETYNTSYMHKLGFQSRVELIHYAIGKGWLSAP